jgi:opacity protein-like surface antigen
MNRTETAIALALTLALGSPAFAQAGRGAVVSVGSSVMTMEGDSGPTYSGTVGYRFTPNVSAGMEFTFAPNVSRRERRFPLPLGDVRIAGSPISSLIVQDHSGRTTIFTGNLRVTVPTGSRLEPFVVAGAGAATISDDVDYEILYSPVLLARPTIFPPPRIRQSASLTTTDFTVTIGGGAGWRMSDRWSVDGEARYFGVLGRQDISIGRYGGGVTFHF